MEHRFATHVEQILSALPARPKIYMRAQAPLPPLQYAVVCDANTYKALGGRLAQELSAPCVLLPDPVPDMATVAHLQRETKNAQALAAVGGGTINDLCKYASFLDGKPYAVFPTAASMNGYTSANASIIAEGKKQSHAAHLPVAVCCDMEVIAAAPVRLMRAGLGDSLARSTAQADWLLSHYLRGTHYDARPFEMLAPYEPALLENLTPMHLMNVLLLSGFGMTLAGGSYPASQGEHMIAHTYESMFGAGDTLHGEQIGVTTLTMARLQESVIARIANGDSRAIQNWIPLEFAAQIRGMTSFMLPSARIEAILKAAGCPTTPRELGWDEAQYNEAVRQARFSRDRFTFLNLNTN